MDQIVIRNLEVQYRVGVPEAERAQKQKLLLSIELDHDFRAAAATDSLEATVDYYAVAQRLLRFGEGRSWKLIESLACEIAEMILQDFKAESVCVEVKKFVIAEADHVAVRVCRKR